MMKEKIICTCPSCKTQFFEKIIKIGKWGKEQYKGKDNEFKYFHKYKITSFNCSECKKLIYMYSLNKFAGKEEIGKEKIKPWWKF